MIGIPILDNLSEEELVDVALGRITIRVAGKPPRPIMIEDNPEPQLNQFKEMDNERVITLCKMEIESRLGWIYLKELIDSKENS